MNHFRFLLPFFILYILYTPAATGQSTGTRLQVVVLYENGGHHLAFSQKAIAWLEELGKDSSLSFTYLTRTDRIDSSFLDRFQLFIQLDYPPYNWTKKAAHAFEQYIDQGRGGWIGLHHATLLGEFDGFPLWQWFSDFMGGIQFRDYIPGFAHGQVWIEKKEHPCMKDLPDHFVIENEEWYTYTKSPRSLVNVLAHVDESSYQPPSTIIMGDHPVIWSNDRKAARNVYIFMGHSPDLFQNEHYRMLLKNTIWWTGRLMN